MPPRTNLFHLEGAKEAWGKQYQSHCLDLSRMIRLNWHIRVLPPGHRAEDRLSNADAGFQAEFARLGRGNVCASGCCA